jgi:hypothetical protein
MMPASSKPALFPPLRFHLPDECGLAGVESFAHLCEKLRPFSGEGGIFNSRLQQRKQALLELIERGGKPEIDTLDTLRVILDLWRENPGFLLAVPLDSSALRAMRRLLPRLSRPLLWQLIQLYLEHYDRLPAYRELADWLRRAFDDLPSGSRESHAMQAFRGEREWLFSHGGPARLSALAHQRRLRLPALMKNCALPETGRFVWQALQQHYLAPLEALKPGEDHPLLAELAEDEVKLKPMPDGLLLGHHAGKLLMDKVLAATSAGLASGLPENWRRALIGILDEPRVPRASPRFQTWWARLDKKYLNAMRAWLSQLDLKLFLNILEDVAHTHDKQDLLRMFPARKRFLEGLYQQGLIQESRLLLGSRAEKYIRETFAVEALPEFGRLDQADVSLIYLNLQGAHFIEGTHLFQVRLYHELPIPGLADYEERNFSLAAIRKYRADVTLRHAHGKLPRWQRELIEALSQPPFNVPVSPRHVLSAGDYQAWLRAFPADGE